MSCSLLRFIDWGQCREMAIEDMDVKDLVKEKDGNKKMFKVLLGITIASAVLAVGAAAVALTVTLAAAFFWTLVAAAGVALLIHALSLAALLHNHYAGEKSPVHSRHSMRMQDVYDLS